MSLAKYVERIRRIDAMIHLKATGTPEVFASKLGISRSTLFQALQEMREMGVNIKYSWELRSYYYADNRRIRINIENILSEEEILEASR